jgi:hypothetical protein
MPLRSVHLVFGPQGDGMQGFAVSMGMSTKMVKLI